MADIMAVLKANTSDFTAKLAEAKASTKELSDEGSSNFSKLSSVGGIAAAALGAGIVAVGAASIDLAEKYQTTTANIANAAGISTAAAQKISGAFLDTAGKTIFSGQQIGTAYASVAGQLGATQGHALNAAQAMTVMNAAMDLAEATGTDLNTATTSLAAVMQSFGEKANMAAMVSTTLYNGARMTGVGVDTLSQAVDKAKTKLGGMSPPVEQLTGLLVDMANHGETGRAAMSALTTSFTAFLKPASDVATAQANLKAASDALPPSLKALAAGVQSGAVSYETADKAAQNMGYTQYSLMEKFLSASSAATTASQAQEKMGVTAVDASGHMLPLGNIIGQLQTQIKGMGTAQAIAQLTADGFSGASAKLVGVIQAGPAAFQKATAAVVGSNSAHAAAERQAATLKDQLETLKAAAEDYATKLGEVLIPKIQSVISFFEKHKAIAEVLAGIIGGVLVVAIGAWGVSMAKAFGAKALDSIRGLVLGFQELTGAELEADAAADANPFGLIVIAVAALVAAIVELVAHWTTVWNTIKSVFDQAVAFLRSGFGTLVVMLTGPLAPLIELGLHWQTVFGAIRDIVTTVWGVIKPIFDLIRDVIQVQLTVAITVFKGLWQAMWIIIGTVIQTVWGIVQPIFNLIKSIIQADLTAAITVFRGIWQAVWDAVSAAVSAANAVLAPIISAIETAISGISSAINAMKSAWDAVWSGISGAVSAAWSAMSGIFNDIKQGASDVGNALSKITNNPVTSFLGHLAGGGPAQANTPYIIGENGPELFIPSTSGVVVPNGVLSNPTGNITPLPDLAGGTNNPGALQAQIAVNVTLDNAPFIQALQTAVLQYQRGTASPVFGTSQTLNG